MPRTQARAFFALTIALSVVTMTASAGDALRPDQVVYRELFRELVETNTTLNSRGPAAMAPPLAPGIMKPIEQVAAQIYPGVPLLPLFQAGATDGRGFLC